MADVLCPVLVGRDEQLRALDGVLETALAGRGGLVAQDSAGTANFGARPDATIEHTIEQYIERLNASDVRGAVDLYTEDGVLIQPEQDTAVGKQQLEAAYENGFLAVDLDMRISHADNIAVEGDLASVQTSTTGTITIRADGAMVPSDPERPSCSGE